MADAFEDEAEQTVTIDEYIEELEAEELVRFALKNPVLFSFVSGIWGFLEEIDDVPGLI